MPGNENDATEEDKARAKQTMASAMALGYQAAIHDVMHLLKEEPTQVGMTFMLFKLRNRAEDRINEIINESIGD